MKTNIMCTAFANSLESNDLSRMQSMIAVQTIAIQSGCSASINISFSFLLKKPLSFIKPKCAAIFSFLWSIQNY